MRIHCLSLVPEIKPQMVSHRKAFRTAHQGHRSTRPDFVACLLEQFLRVLEYGDEVVFVLNLKSIAGIVVPSSKNHGSVKRCHHEGIGRSRYIQIRVSKFIESFADHAFYRLEEMYSLKRKIPFHSCRQVELLLLH